MIAVVDDEDVLSLGAEQRVGAGLPEEGVVAGLAFERVVAETAAQVVVAGGAPDDVVRRIADAGELAGAVEGQILDLAEELSSSSAEAEAAGRGGRQIVCRERRYDVIVLAPGILPALPERAENAAPSRA